MCRPNHELPPSAPPLIRILTVLALSPLRFASPLSPVHDDPCPASSPNKKREDRCTERRAYTHPNTMKLTRRQVCSAHVQMSGLTNEVKRKLIEPDSSVQFNSRFPRSPGSKAMFSRSPPCLPSLPPLPVPPWPDHLAYPQALNGLAYPHNAPSSQPGGKVAAKRVAERGEFLQVSCFTAGSPSLSVLLGSTQLTTESSRSGELPRRLVFWVGVSRGYCRGRQHRQQMKCTARGKLAHRINRSGRSCRRR
ncbi:unnamed protein product [Protopolystoma xenopodis]|uniref:Uncharacterized protein n=1 Tax=Protopolystoma xenopodis TaxID=117903 RepID=A0A3S5AV68_9PLAT|nr:unnamed protein product [Protopolystoma xenopodis]